MKKIYFILIMFVWIVLPALLVRTLQAQGYGGPLTYQGMDQFLLQSAASRGMGGITIGSEGDIAVMFTNPASLTTIQGMQISIGGQMSDRNLNQEQNYAPVRYYSNLSLLLEGKTGGIPDPDTSLVGFSPQDTVQRPYDNIGPNWSRSESSRLPLQVMLAVPVTLGRIRLAAGAGIVTYADLSHYFQNNNVLSPAILSQRPLPTLRPTDDKPIEVAWDQSMRSRDGSIRGYGIALAGLLEKYDLALGISGVVLKGSSDDSEQQVGRGSLTFFSNAFRADSVYSRITKTGTSDYSGFEFTFSGILKGRFVSIGFSVKPPNTITRTFDMRVSTDTSGTPLVSMIHGEDKLRLSWRGTAGLSFALRENLRLGLEYEYRPYESVRYTDFTGQETTPWLPASLFRVGAEYKITPWMILRGGMQGEAEIFQPEGNEIADEPVSYTIYSAGLGFLYKRFHLDVTYQNSDIKYQDTWASAISKNSTRINTIVAQVSYEFTFLAD